MVTKLAEGASNKHSGRDRKPAAAGRYKPASTKDSWDPVVLYFVRRLGYKSMSDRWVTRDCQLEPPDGALTATRHPMPSGQRAGAAAAVSLQRNEALDPLNLGAVQKEPERHVARLP